MHPARVRPDNEDEPSIKLSDLNGATLTYKKQNGETVEIEFDD